MRNKIKQRVITWLVLLAIIVTSLPSLPSLNVKAGSNMTGSAYGGLPAVGQSTGAGKGSGILTGVYGIKLFFVYCKNAPRALEVNKNNKAKLFAKRKKVKVGNKKKGYKYVYKPTYNTWAVKVKYNDTNNWSKGGKIAFRPDITKTKGFNRGASLTGLAWAVDSEKKGKKVIKNVKTDIKNGAIMCWGVAPSKLDAHHNGSFTIGKFKRGSGYVCRTRLTTEDKKTHLSRTRKNISKWNHFAATEEAIYKALHVDEYYNKYNKCKRYSDCSKQADKDKITKFLHKKLNLREPTKISNYISCKGLTEAQRKKRIDTLTNAAKGFFKSDYNISDDKIKNLTNEDYYIVMDTGMAYGVKAKQSDDEYSYITFINPQAAYYDSKNWKKDNKKRNHITLKHLLNNRTSTEFAEVFTTSLCLNNKGNLGNGFTKWTKKDPEKWHKKRKNRKKFYIGYDKCGFTGKEGYGVFIPAFSSKSTPKNRGALNVAVIDKNTEEHNDKNNVDVSSAFICSKNGTNYHYDRTKKKLEKIKTGTGSGNQHKDILGVYNSAKETTNKLRVKFADNYTLSLNKAVKVKDLLNLLNKQDVKDELRSNIVKEYSTKLVESDKYKGVGYTKGIKSIRYGKKGTRYENTKGIQSKLVDAVKSASTTKTKLEFTVDGYLSYNDEAAKNAFKVVTVCWDNFYKKAFGRLKSLSNTDAVTVKSTKSEDTVKVKKKNKKIGLSIEYICRGKSVHSSKFLYTGLIDLKNPGNSGVTSAKTTETKQYAADTTATLKVDKGVVCYIVMDNNTASNSLSDINNFIDDYCKTKANNNIASYGDFSKQFIGKFGAIAEDNGTNSPTYVLGCTEKEPTIGYTIVEVKLNLKAPTSEKSKGVVELPSYMLNRYFDNIIAYSSVKKAEADGDGNPENCRQTFKLREDWSAKTFDNTGDWEYRTCRGCHNKFISGYDTTYCIRYKDVGKTTEFEFDNDKPLGGLRKQYYYPKATIENLWEHSKRLDLATEEGVVVDTEHLPENRIIEYAFNLVRTAVGDNRSISGIRYETYEKATNDTLNVLRLKDNYGIKPTVKYLGTIREPETLDRNKPADLAYIFNENFEIDMNFVRSMANQQDIDGKHPKTVTHGCHWDTHTSSDGSSYSHYHYTLTHYSMIKHGAQGIEMTTPSGKSKVFTNKMTYKFENDVYKYQTIKMDNGINDCIKDKDMISVSMAAVSPSGDGDDHYRFATSHYNGASLRFYPEVKMVYKVGSREFDENPYRVVSTMGEIERVADSSSLYLYKLNKLDNHKSITGTTTTDSALGGTVSKGKNKITIPAGSDVTVAADTSNYSIDLYGYALDVIKPTDDFYKSIVKGDFSTVDEWKDTETYTQVRDHFSTWCKNMLSPKNYAADFELYLDGSSTSKSENFSATVGKIKRASSEPVDTGLYCIQIENGKVLKSKSTDPDLPPSYRNDYVALVSQIASDYRCTNQEAEAILEKSGILTSALNAIESSTSPFNNSKKAKPGDSPDAADWTPSLGNNKNWYDEKVYTLVIRRFKSENNLITDVTASDKVDLGLSNGASGNSSKQNSNAGVADRTATWKLNLFFNQDNFKELNKNMFSADDKNTFYNPKDGAGDKINIPTQNYHVLFRGMPVKDADFNISASSTFDF